jgi:hypothetical protein
VALALSAGFLLVAFVSISVAVSSSATDGHSAQAPLGVLSANDEEQGGTLGQQTPGGGQGQPSDIQPNVAGEETASLPSTGSGSSGSGGGNNPASLPFTGLIAIPILLVGVAMLGAGLLLRRRKPTNATA